MKVYYKTVGELKRKLAEKNEGLKDVPDGSTVQNFLEILGLENKGLVIMVNGRKAAVEELLNEGDRITIIPVAIGG